MTYRFEGCVYRYQRIVDDHYVAETEAVSLAKARNNLAARWKKDNGYEPYLRVRLEGEFTEVTHTKEVLPPPIEELQEVISFE